MSNQEIRSNLSGFSMTYNESYFNCLLPELTCIANTMMDRMQVKGYDQRQEYCQAFLVKVMDKHKKVMCARQPRNYLFSMARNIIRDDMRYYIYRERIQCKITCEKLNSFFTDFYHNNEIN